MAGEINPPEGFEERLVDGPWGISTLLSKIEGEIRPVLEADGGNDLAVVQWRVLRRKA